MRVVLIFLILVSFACDGPTQPEVKADKLFERLPATATGITFSNTLSFKEDFDVFRYRNYYNGAGVGIGDLNNDGLPDLYLTSNMGDNKLFLNKGGMTFEDITARAGVGSTKIWSTGVSLADVNADGFLDIYVCNSGDVKGGNQENELFINNGDLTFSERAVEYGLADKGFSTHAVFFDYDLDGDLDCYVLNNSFQPPSSLGLSNRRGERDKLGGDKLYQNNKGHFTDVSQKAGIYSSLIGFGLGVTAGDVNQDGWPDLYVSNDFFERDYLYLNNHDGTFSDKIEQSLGHISMFSMGADIADLNNDRYPEIFSTDMLPKDDYRLKTLVAFERYDVYQLRVKNDYYHQYMRNMLHKNNHDGTFSEIGRFAGVEATDWSWGSLIADFDNDGFKDIFVSNGIYKDVTNQDFVEFLGSEQIHAAMEGKQIDYADFLEKMPSQKISNFMFHRAGEWRYENVASAWGLDEPSFSNGAAYGDLDNDGDLDLVVNNVNQELFVYRNRVVEKNGSNSLSIIFKGSGANTFGIGASVIVTTKEDQIMQEHYPIRGYQSSMDYKMIVGLGEAKVADTLTVRWPDGKVQEFVNVSAGESLSVDYRDAEPVHIKAIKKNLPALIVVETQIAHHENDFDDFDQDRLAYHMMSTQGPAFAKTDLNKDGFDDFYVGGSVGNPGSLYLQSSAGNFLPVALRTSAVADETAASFFDADGDGDDDLYIVTGGTEYVAPASALRDHFFENVGMKNGTPQFQERSDKIPHTAQSGSCVRPADFDGDGDIDLFIGTRVIAGSYGKRCDQYLFLNDGKGNFKDVSATVAPKFRGLGMVSDAFWYDHDRNGFLDLMIVGEWLPVKLFLNDGRTLKSAEVKGLENSSGWWNRISTGDVDRDGDLDFILGNLGCNSKFKSDSSGSVKLFVNDFDKNGSVDAVFAYTSNGVDYPLTSRNDLLSQMTSYRKNFVYHKDYAGKSIQEIFGDKLLRDASVHELRHPETSILINHEKNGFELKPLPVEAQFAPVYAMLYEDVDKDGFEDLILGGNLYGVKPEAGRYDAIPSLVLRGNGRGQFKIMSSETAGIRIQGQLRHIDTLKAGKKTLLVFLRNNDRVVIAHYR
jgi:hypothetical protein